MFMKAVCYFTNKFNTNQFVSIQMDHQPFVISGPGGRIFAFRNDAVSSMFSVDALTLHSWLETLIGCKTQPCRGGPKYAPLLCDV